MNEPAHTTIDESLVRAAVAAAVNDAGTPLSTEVAEVAIDGTWVAVILGGAITSPGMLRHVHRAVTSALPGVDVDVRYAGRIYRGGGGFGDGKHIVAVLGGKGGVGKSTVAVNLALTLSAMGARVGLIDCDVNAPDIPHMLGVREIEPDRRHSLPQAKARLAPPSRRRRPHECYGIQVMSVGFEIPERFAPRVTSRMLVSTLLRDLIFEVNWSADVLVLDAPPGTGEELQVIAGELPISGALFVTTPQDLAQMDAERTLALLAEHGVPVIGVVKNMAALACPHCDREIDLYGQSTRLADAGVPVIGSIPFDVGLSAAADKGRPLVLGEPTGPIAYEFARIGSYTRRWLAEHEHERVLSS